MMETDIFEQIREDHRMVGDLIDQLMEQSHGEGRMAASQIADMLVPHAKAEEAGLYSALMEHDQARKQIEKALAEHQEIVQHINDLAQVSSGEEKDVRSHLKQLRNVIESHVRDEESKTFGFAQDLLSDQQIMDLSRRFPMDKQEFGRGFRLAA